MFYSNTVHDIPAPGLIYYEVDKMEPLSLEGLRLVLTIRDDGVSRIDRVEAVQAYLILHGAAFGSTSISTYRLSLYNDCPNLSASETAKRLEKLIDATNYLYYEIKTTEARVKTKLLGAAIVTN